MTAFVAGQKLTAAQLNAAFDQYLPIGTVSSLSQDLLSLSTTAAWLTALGSGGGTVTSVAMSLPTGLALSGSPITGSGTFAVTWSGIIPVAQGSTGIATYVIGDLLYASGTGALSRLADIATGNALVSGGVGVAPAWGKIGLTTHITGTLAVGNGGTGITTLAVGDTLYASALNTFSKLTIGANGSFYSVASGVPVYVAPATAANIQAATAGNPVTPDGVLSAMAWATLTPGTTVNINHASGVNCTLAPAQNFTLAAPTNPKVGWPLNIAIKQPASGGPYTGAYNAAFDFGANGAPVLSTSANAEDLLCFVCRSSSVYAFVGIVKGL